jgi:apolipoprotein N-acyltransferase
MQSRLQRWYHSTFGYALAGAIALWAALPPLGLWPLAWIAPVWWVLLVRRDGLLGKRPYGALWLVGVAFWLAELYWLTFPHPANTLGWAALAMYFGIYLPAFVGLSRVAVHRLRTPVIVAAPVVWTGLELARAHLLTGMTMASLGHTQYRWIGLIQISDLAGAFGVSFVVMFVAACLGRMIPIEGKPRVLWPLAPATVLLATVLVYGHFRMLGDASADRAEPPKRIVLVQGSIDSDLKHDPDRRNEVHEHYCTLTREAVRQFGTPDLIVWPETMFRSTLITYDPDARAPESYRRENVNQEQFEFLVKTAARRSRMELRDLARAFDAPMLIGVERDHFGPDRQRAYNAAVYLDKNGEVLGCYDKMHRVVFGEYVPFADRFPWLQRLTPLPVSLDAGQRPAAFDVGGLRVAPNICFETVLSHVIRRQILALRGQDTEPDVLVNLTNDGWFLGSSELDLHLICGVFRAVESRKPLLIAANTGFSAFVDADGRIVHRGKRRQTDAILAEVRPDPRGSWYLDHGDWPAALCLAACAAFAMVGIWQRVRRRV